MVKIGQNVVDNGQVFMLEDLLHLVLNIPVSGINNGAVEFGFCQHTGVIQSVAFFSAVGAAGEQENIGLRFFQCPDITAVQLVGVILRNFSTRRVSGYFRGFRGDRRHQSHCGNRQPTFGRGGILQCNLTAV